MCGAPGTDGAGADRLPRDRRSVGYAVTSGFSVSCSFRSTLRRVQRVTGSTVSAVVARLPCAFFIVGDGHVSFGVVYLSFNRHFYYRATVVQVVALGSGAFYVNPEVSRPHFHRRTVFWVEYRNFRARGAFVVRAQGSSFVFWVVTLRREPCFDFGP